MRVYLVTAGIFLATWLAVRYLAAFLAPLAVAVLVAAGLEPLVALGGRRGVSRRVSAAAALLIGGGLAAALGVLALVALAGELREAARGLPAYYPQAQRLAADWLAFLRVLQAALPPGVAPGLTDAAGMVLVALQRAASVLLGDIQHLLLSGLPRALATLLAGAAIGFLAVADDGAMRAVLSGGLPPASRPWVFETGRRAWSIAREFLWASLAFAIVTFLFVSLALALLGAPYPVLAGALAGALDLLPAVGPGLLLLPWAAVLALGGQGGAALAVLAVHAGAVVLHWVLQARFARRSLGLHPAVALYALYAGAFALGPAGLVAAPFALVMLRALADAGLLAWPDGAGR